MAYEITVNYQHNRPAGQPAGKAKLKVRRPAKKPFDWISDLNLHVRGETALWVAVITQSLMDALSHAKNSEALYHKHEAINWLTGNSKDFITVCHHAGLDPNYVRRKAKKAIVAPQPWRAEAGKGKRYLERKAYRQRLKTQKAPPPEDGQSGLAPQKIIIGPWN